MRKSLKKQKTSRSAALSASPEIITSVPPSLLRAVIDVGTTALRMTIAELPENKRPRILDTIELAVSLGKDTFTRGIISRETIEECVKAFKSFRRILEEYGIPNTNIRAVATTAVREASNRDAFIDRIAIANDFHIEPIDDTEIARLTYLGIHGLLDDLPDLMKKPLLVIEVGGGAIELLHLRNGGVDVAQSYGVGSLRLREMLESFGAPVLSSRSLMENHIKRTLTQMRTMMPADIPAILALGGDIRFAVRRCAGVKKGPVHHLPIKDFGEFVEEVLSLSVNEAVRQYHISYPEAETLGPAALFYYLCAKEFKVKELLVADVSLRHGLLAEMAAFGSWVELLGDQVIRSAREIGMRYKYDEAHARYVAVTSKIIFQTLQNEHRLNPWHEVLLYVAALLHDIGMFVSGRSHHKHSLYLIQNSELFGLNSKEINLVGLVARYHRRAGPKPTHPEYVALDRESRIVVAKITAILRIADALDRSHTQRMGMISCTCENDALVIQSTVLDDVSLEQIAVASKSGMFEEVYGFKVILRPAGAPV